jgi:membrane-anchored glycerophosphoryl diester phosphodiesterase (GDPDase)
MRAELREAFVRLPWVLAILVTWVVGVALGLVLLVLPGLYLAVALPFAWPALILRKMRIHESIRYSARLSRRNWWRTALIFTVGFVVLFVFYAVGLVFALLLAPVIGAVDLAVVTAVATAVFASMGAFAGPFLCALMIATFGDLQVRMEGSDLERRIAAATHS